MRRDSPFTFGTNVVGSHRRTECFIRMKTNEEQHPSASVFLVVQCCRPAAAAANAPPLLYPSAILADKPFFTPPPRPSTFIGSRTSRSVGKSIKTTWPTISPSPPPSPAGSAPGRLLSVCSFIASVCSSPGQWRPADSLPVRAARRLGGFQPRQPIHGRQHSVINFFFHTDISRMPGPRHGTAPREEAIRQRQLELHTQ